MTGSANCGSCINGWFVASVNTDEIFANQLKSAKRIITLYIRSLLSYYFPLYTAKYFSCVDWEAAGIKSNSLLRSCSIPLFPLKFYDAAPGTYVEPFPRNKSATYARVKGNIEITISFQIERAMEPLPFTRL